MRVAETSRDEAEKTRRARVDVGNFIENNDGDQMRMNRAGMFARTNLRGLSLVGNVPTINFHSNFHVKLRAFTQLVTV
jgi:hypothetical protein